MADWKNKIDLEKLSDDVLSELESSNAGKMVTLQFGDVTSGEKKEEFDKLQLLVNALSAERTRRAESRKANGTEADQKPIELSSNATRNIEIKNMCNT